MPRPLRIEYENAVYHITSRGNARANIFTDKYDYSNFLILLKEVLQKYNWLCYAYCLMPNHYHLLIKTPDANVSQGMKQLNGVYTKRFNKKHSRIGHLFQGRFKGIIVEKDSHLLELCRYIALNPVKTNLAALPHQWPWSSYKEIITNKQIIIEKEWILSQFGKNSYQAIDEYKKFVLAGLEEKENIWNNLKNKSYLGNAKYIQQKQHNNKNEKDSEKPTLKELFPNKLTRKQRNKIIYLAHKNHGYTFTEISKYLGLNCSSTSRSFKKAQQEKNRHKNAK